MNRIKQMITKISKYVFENMESFAIIVALIIAIISFFHQLSQVTPELAKLKQEFNDYIHLAEIKHQELATRQRESRHSLELSLAKVETSLAQITTDIQFIKQRIVFGENKQ